MIVSLRITTSTTELRNSSIYNRALKLSMKKNRFDWEKRNNSLSSVTNEGSIYFYAVHGDAIKYWEAARMIELC